MRAWGESTVPTREAYNSKRSSLPAGNLFTELMSEEAPWGGNQRQSVGSAPAGRENCQVAETIRKTISRNSTGGSGKIESLRESFVASKVKGGSAKEDNLSLRESNMALREQRHSLLGEVAALQTRVSQEQQKLAACQHARSSLEEKLYRCQSVVAHTVQAVDQLMDLTMDREVEMAKEEVRAVGLAVEGCLWGPPGQPKPRTSEDFEICEQEEDICVEPRAELPQCAHDQENLIHAFNGISKLKASNEVGQAKKPSPFRVPLQSINSIR